MDLSDSLCTILQGLCPSCQRLDISTFQFENQQIPETDKPFLSLGKPLKKISLLKCPPCRLFFSVSTEYKRNYRRYVLLFDRIPRPPSESVSGEIPPSPFLYVFRENSRLVYNYEIADEMGQKGVIVYRSQTVNEHGTVQTIEPTAINYQVLKS